MEYNEYIQKRKEYSDLFFLLTSIKEQERKTSEKVKELKKEIEEYEDKREARLRAYKPKED